MADLKVPCDLRTSQNLVFVLVIGSGSLITPVSPPSCLSVVFPPLITFSFPVLLLCRTTIRCACLWQRPPSAAPPSPSRSWEVTQFPMIQCVCFCCVVAGAILRGPLIPTVTALWIMDKETDRVLDRGGEREGRTGKGREDGESWDNKWKEIQRQMG